MYIYKNIGLHKLPQAKETEALTSNYNYLGRSVGVGIRYWKDDTENAVQFSTRRETFPFFEGSRSVLGNI
jgi:hypothetical protein